MVFAYMSVGAASLSVLHRSDVYSTALLAYLCHFLS